MPGGEFLLLYWVAHHFGGVVKVQGLVSWCCCGLVWSTLGLLAAASLQGNQAWVVEGCSALG